MKVIQNAFMPLTLPFESVSIERYRPKGDSLKKTVIVMCIVNLIVCSTKKIMEIENNLNIIWAFLKAIKINLNGGGVPIVF